MSTIGDWLDIKYVTTKTQQTILKKALNKIEKLDFEHKIGIRNYDGGEIHANPSILEVSECLFFTERVKLGNCQKFSFPLLENNKAVVGVICHLTESLQAEPLLKIFLKNTYKNLKSSGPFYVRINSIILYTLWYYSMYLKII